MTSTAIAITASPPKSSHELLPASSPEVAGLAVDGAETGALAGGGALAAAGAAGGGVLAAAGAAGRGVFAVAGAADGGVLATAGGAGLGGGGLDSLASTSRSVTTFGGPSVTIVAVSLSRVCRSENETGRPFLKILMPRFSTSPSKYIWNPFWPRTIIELAEACTTSAFRTSVT